MNAKIEKPITVVIGVKDGQHHVLVYSPDWADKCTD
jgi:hypothetical protein